MGKIVFVDFLWYACQSVLYSGAYLLDSHQIYLDMTSRPTVFQEVDRYISQIKFYLKSLLIPDRKKGTNSNNLLKSEGRNLCFETLSL